MQQTRLHKTKIGTVHFVDDKLLISLHQALKNVKLVLASFI